MADIVLDNNSFDLELYRMVKHMIEQKQTNA